MSGILNWQLQGLQKLLVNNGFTESASQKIINTKFLRHSDTIQAFLNEVCITGSNKTFTIRSDAYEAYKSFCEQFGLEPETIKRFTQQLRETNSIFDQKKLVLGKNERLLIYFLMLWASSFFFGGLYQIVSFGPSISRFIQDMIAFLSALAALFAGVVLGLFSWKLLNETE
jgi:hypothetical protein